MIVEVVEHGIALVTVTESEALGRYEKGPAYALRNALVDIGDDDSLRVAILSIDDTVQSSADPHDASDAARPRLDIYAGPAGLYQTLAYSRKVLITEVTGVATPVTSAILLSSDLTVADSDATFASPFGAVVEANFVLAVLTMRLDRAKWWALSDRPLSAADARAFGLVNVIADRGHLRDQSMRLAKAATKMPLDGITVSKMNVNAVLDSMGVGRDFDGSGFFAAGMTAPHELGWE